MNDSAVTRFRGEHFALSNFAPYPSGFDGVVYPTSEHAFIAAKTSDLSARARLHAMPTAVAKEFGRTVVLRPDWEEVRLHIMLEILRSKFTDNPGSAAVLIGTGDRDLIEGNAWHDNFWGACSCSGCGGLPKQNNLGKLLMQVRTELSDVKRTAHNHRE